MDVRPYLAGSDLLLMPSEEESFCVAALEAMSCGVPVVATRVGGVPELVLDDESGRLVPAERPDRLAAALLDLLADAEARVRFAAAGRERVQAEFSFAGQMERLASVYARAARSPA